MQPEEEGFEPPQDFPGETTVSEQGGAGSGARAALTAVADPDLAAVVDAWPTLPEVVKAGVMAMVKVVSEKG